MVEFQTRWGPLRECFLGGEPGMLILTIAVDAPGGQAIGAKEAIAQDLEKYGDVRVVAVTEKKPEQQSLFEVEMRQ